MAKIYYKIIKRGDMTIEEVPPLFRAKTKELLDADNEA